jgi:hypothetical protein
MKVGPEYNITLHKSPQVHKYLILQTRFSEHKSKGILHDMHMDRLHIFINKQKNSVLNLNLKQVGLKLVMFTSTKNY